MTTTTRSRLRSSRLTGPLAGLVVFVVLAVLPLSASPYLNLQIALIGAYAVAIRGLDVLTGHAGQASLGQSAFFGLGAYITVYGFGHGWPAPVSLLAATLGAGLVGVVLALPAVRLRGFAFGTITLALPIIAVPLANRLTGLTGGSQGLTVSALSAPSWSGLADDQWHYYVVLVVAGLAFLLVQNTLRGRIGRGLDLLRTNETVATATGVPVLRYKVTAFTIAALCGGLAGWLYVVLVEFISPEALQLNLAVFMLVAVIVGGLRSPLGSVLGAAFYVLVPEITDEVAPGRSFLVFGGALLIVLIFFPAGISGGLASFWAKVAPGRPRASTPENLATSQGAMSCDEEPLSEPLPRPVP